jgi:tRNA(Ile)-lysidine synthase
MCVTHSPDALAARELDDRLQRGAVAPIAVALSGGGDSLALLLAADAWARQANRRLIALTVDHGLQASSVEWSAWCAARAGRLGVSHRSLEWPGNKPRTGLAAVARAARHQLIGEAAREEGARVILFGHTADDLLEAEAMRAEGLSVPSPRVWSPSPVWPAGRDLYILRPFIGVRRLALRDWLAAQGETCIDDPANEDMRQPRARARALVAAARRPPGTPAPPIDLSALFESTRFGPSGDLTVPAEALAAAAIIDRRRFLDAAIASVAGAERIAHGPFFFRLGDMLGRGESFSSTVGGALTTSNGTRLSIARETQDRRSRSPQTTSLPAGETVVWDGRFEVRAVATGLTLTSLAGRAAQLGKAEKAQLAPLEPAVRRALPAVIDPSGAVICPSLVPDPRIDVRSLVTSRLAGACGMVQKEAEIGEAARALVL